MHLSRREQIRPTINYIYGPQSYSQKRTIISRDKNKKVKKWRKEESAEKSAVKQFMEFTSLPGFAQYGRQTNKLGRIFWLLAFFGGLSLGIYQSWGLIDDYFQYKVYQQTVTHVNATMGWPALTLCGKNPIRWKDAVEDEAIPSLLETNYEETIEKYKLYNLSNTKQRFIKEHILLSILRTYWQNDISPELFTDVDKFILVCLWDYVEECNISKAFIQFYQGFYGMCYTFNSGLIPGVGEIAVETGKSLTMAAYLDLDQEVPFLSRNTGIVALIHEPGTAPVLNRANIIHLQAGQWMKVGLNLETYVRLPAPYPSKCVQEGDKKLQKSSVFYDNEKPYRYSFEACVASCMQKENRKNCDCVSQKIPWDKNETVDLCHYQNGCVQNFSKYHPDVCWCPFRCKENIYKSTVIFEPDLMRFQYWREAAKELFAPVLHKLNFTVMDQEFLSSRIVVIEMYFESALYQETVEFAKYTIADFWGAIGGNVGFWTGISVLSLVEVIELLYLIFKKK